MQKKVDTYLEILKKLKSIMDGVTDEIACLSTVACEVYHAFDSFHWVGFYRVTEPDVLMVGPYQGEHGCLRIPFERGVCGAAARMREVQIVDDVNTIIDHIACSSSTVSEIVVPVFDQGGELCAVFDIDSDVPANFDSVDKEGLVKICQLLTERCYPVSL